MEAWSKLGAPIPVGILAMVHAADSGPERKSHPWRATSLSVRWESYSIWDHCNAKTGLGTIDTTFEMLGGERCQ